MSERRIDHEQLFLIEDGAPIRDIKEVGNGALRWNLMIGRNPLWVSTQHGHNVRTMLEIYAAWAEGAVESDVDAIRRAMGFDDATTPANAHGFASSLPHIR